MVTDNEMSNEEAIKELKEDLELYIPIGGTIDDVDRETPDGRLITALEMAIQALDSWREYSEKLWQQAYDRGVKDGILFTMDKECEDCVSREEVMKLLEKEDWADTVVGVLSLPPVQPPGKELYDCFRVGAAIQNIVSRVDKETLEQIKEYLGEIETIVRGDTDDD